MSTNALHNIIPTQNDRYFIANLSEIVTTDQKLLKKTVHQFRPNSRNYEDSWGYIIQATRYGGFKWYDQKSGSLIFFGKKSENDSTLVVPSFFASAENLAHIIKKIENALQTYKTIVKNVNAEEIGAYTPYGFRPYKSTEFWVADARFDDQTYPQILIDLKKTTEVKGTYYQNLRTALNKKPKVVIKKYRKTDQDAVLELFTRKDSVSNDFSIDLQGMYYTSHNMYVNGAVEKFVIIDEQDQELIGFTATSDITSENTALIASIFKPGVKVESVWGIYKTLEIKYREGFLKINLGGNETKETFNFMREKFRPVELLYKTHLIYDPKE